MDDNRITYFAETDARNKRVKFGIKAKDRTRHVYVLGKTGMGKSTLLENMAVQDIQSGEGMCFIDPHGKTADLMLEYVPKDRVRDVIYIAPFDTEYPISFNVLESVDPDKRHLVVSGLMSTFKKIWVDAWSARMEYILTNTLLALLEAPNSTLLGVNRMLSDKAYRNEIVSYVKDPSVKAFWVKEFANYTERQAAEAVPAIQNKVGQFTANPLIRNMIGQPVSSFDFREAMDKRKIMIINLSKGKIGDENMKLLGGLLVTKIYLAAMSRADVPDRVMKMLPNFYLFVDEFQNFANASFADILSEARKYKLNLTIAHQYVEQMDEFVRPAVFGNVGTMMIFRVGASDAEILEKEFAPQFEIEDLVNLGFAQIYLKLMIDGLTSAPFSATTLPPIAHPDVSYVKEIIDASREQFAKPRAGVEVEIVKFHEPMVKKPEVRTMASPTASSATPTASSAASIPPVSKPTVPMNPIKTTYSVPRTAAVPTSPATASPATASPATVTPKPKPPVEMHQPFKSALGDALKAVTAKPAPIPTSSSATIQTPASPAKIPVIQQSVQQPKSIPITPKQFVPSPVSVPSVPPPPSPVKPVSLSALSAQQPQKVNPKAQSPQNVNDLKNALAAVLGKQSPKPIQPTIQPTVQVAQTASPVSKPVPSAPRTPEPPREVPEEELRRVLKME